MAVGKSRVSELSCYLCWTLTLFCCLTDVRAHIKLHIQNCIQKLHAEWSLVIAHFDNLNSKWNSHPNADSSQLRKQNLSSNNWWIKIYLAQMRKSSCQLYLFEFFIIKASILDNCVMLANELPDFVSSNLDTHLIESILQFWCCNVTITVNVNLKSNALNMVSSK